MRYAYDAAVAGFLLSTFARPRTPYALVECGRGAVVSLSRDPVVRWSAAGRPHAAGLVRDRRAPTDRGGRGRPAGEPGFALPRGDRARGPARHDAALSCDGAARCGGHRVVSVRPQEIRARAAAAARGRAVVVAEARRRLEPS